MSQSPNNRGSRKPIPGRPVPKNLGNSPRGPRDYSVAAEDEDFRPPNPTNVIGRARPGLVIGWALTILGIIALVVEPFLPINWPGTVDPWVTPGLILVIIIGVVTLFMQMPKKHQTRGDGAQL